MLCTSSSLPPNSSAIQFCFSNSQIIDTWAQHQLSLERKVELPCDSMTMLQHYFFSYLIWLLCSRCHRVSLYWDCAQTQKSLTRDSLYERCQPKITNKRSINPGNHIFECFDKTSASTSLWLIPVHTSVRLNTQSPQCYLVEIGAECELMIFTYLALS